MDPRPSPPIGLADLEGVRRLARVLVHGDADADDLAQDAVLVALERPPRSGYTPRSWLAGIARRLAKDRRRRDATRRRHEQAAARAEAGATGLDVHEHLARRRLVLEAVAALPPDAAEAVCLRYFEDLPPREVAARLAVPVETARTRVKRALARLREDLDRRETGGRAAWGAALLPLAGPARAPSAAPMPEVLVMTTTTKGLVAAAAVAVVAGVAWTTLRASDRGEDGRAVAPAVASAGEGALAAWPAAPSSAAAPAAGTAAPASTTVPVAPLADRAHGGVEDGATVEGAVRDAAGRPVVGALVTLGPDGLLPFYVRAPTRRLWSMLEVRTDPEGRFRFSGVRPRDRYALRILDADGAPAFLPSLSWVAREPATLGAVTIAPGAVATGRVVDAEGAPVAGARVVALAPMANPLGFVLADADAQPALDADVVTGADGRFRTTRLAGGLRAFVVEAAGHAAAVVRATLPAEASLELGDVRLLAGGSISGRVLLADGTAVPGARVLVLREQGGVAYAADVADDGTFVLEGVPPGTTPVVAFVPGLTPLFGPSVPTGTTGVELRFPRPGRLVGRVVDASGAPVRAFSVVAKPVASPEDLMAAMAESAVAAVLGASTFSSEDGTFVLAPLDPRAYTLEVVAPGFSSGAVGPVSVPSGADSARAEVRLGTAEGLSGVVLDGGGKPVAGAVVVAQARGATWADAPAARGGSVTATDTGLSIDFGPRLDPPTSVATGPDGRFAFPPLAPGAFGVTVHAAGFAPWFRAGVDAVAAEPLRVTLARGGAVHGRVRTAAGSAPPAVRLVGAQGSVVASVGADGAFSASHVPTGRYVLLPDLGRLVEAALPDDPRELLAACGGSEVAVTEGSDVARDVVVPALSSVVVEPPPASAGTTVVVEDVSAHRVDPSSGTEARFVGPFVHTAHRADDGTATLRGLLPGAYELTAFVWRTTVASDGTTSGAIAQTRLRLVVPPGGEPVRCRLE